jgi:hypothetical protein
MLAVRKRPAPKRRLVAAFSACLALVGLLCVAPAAAEPHPLTPYERTRVDAAIVKLGLPPKPDPAPQGKIVESIAVEVLDVFDDSDPIPNFVNVFHANTRERIVRRELLFAEGSRFDSARADESARNLRKLRQHSLVVVLAFPGSAPDRVRVLVLVKDVWSLRLNGSYELYERGLSYLALNLAEENLLGTHTTFGVLYALDAGTYAWGVHAQKRSLFGSDVDLLASGSIIYGRATGEPEGSSGKVVYGAPFASAASEWSWGTGVEFYDRMARVFDAGRVYRYDAPGTAAKEALPVSFRAERTYGGYEVTRSFGLRAKLDVTAGIEVDRRKYHWGTPPGTDPAAASEFRDEWVPVSDTRVSPFAQLYTHREEYLRTAELETLGVEENYRLGFATLLRLYPASRSFGSSRDLLGALAAASYTRPLGDGLLRVGGLHRVEVERSGKHEADAMGALRIASPRVTFLRVVLDGVVRSRYRNYLNRDFRLGGDTRLRGYPLAGIAGSRQGPSVAAVNAELRTRSIDILGTEVGAVVFYDAGDAGRSIAGLRFRQSMGVGARVALPFFSREVWRFDWAFPFTPVGPIQRFPGTFFLTFEQAFPMPELGVPTVMDPAL